MSSQGSSQRLASHMCVICDGDLRRFTSLNLVVKWQAERAGPLGQRREDGSPLGPTPGDARDRFTTAVPD